MPDITMCSSENCTEKDSCYRARAEPESSQTWWNFEYNCNENNGFEHFIKCDNRDSYERLKSIRRSLSALSKDLDEQYSKMRQECMEEINKDRKEYIVKKTEMYSLYKKLEEHYSMRMTWIKNKLPWYITKFHKISSTEMFFKDITIFIGVNFGKSQKANCYIQITPIDIGWK